MVSLFALHHMSYLILIQYKDIMIFMHSKQAFNSILETLNRNKKLFLCFCFLYYPMITDAMNAGPILVLPDGQQTRLSEYNVWHQIQALDKAPTFEELSRFYLDSEQVKSIFGSRGAFISKIKLSNIKDKKNTWFVNISAAYLDVGTAYWQSDSGEVITLESFGQMDARNPRLAHSQAFSLSLDSQETGTLWIYIQAKMFATPAVIKFYSKTEFYRTQYIINNVTAISFTMMMTLALIALSVYLRTGYLVTLACTGYIGIQGLGWFLASGSLGHLFTFSTFNPVYFGIILFPLAIASACQFTKLLFNCHMEHPKFTKVFDVLSYICLVLGMLMPFLSFTISYLISHVIAIVWIPLCITTGVYMLTKKDFRAKYYLLGNSLYGLTLAGYVISHIYHLDWNISLEVIVQIALTIDCICILLSLTEWLQIQQKEFHRSYEISRIDPLTNIGNRFSLNEILARLIGDYCITFIDLDGFKNINDNFGHEEGDKILIAAAEIIQKKIHGLGSVYRCGGDEFIVVVNIKNSQQVESLLMELSTLLLESEKELQQRGWDAIGFSFGIATSFETLNQSECLSLADQRMYKHKHEK